MASMTDSLENKLIDFLFRGQAYTPPATWYVGLLTAAPSDSAAGTEVVGNGYARVAVAASLANFAGTQSAGSTTASTGTSGTTSNNGTITFPAPSGGNWGTVTHLGLYTLASGGDLEFQAALTASRVINDGDTAPNFAIGALTLQIDN